MKPAQRRAQGWQIMESGGSVLLASMMTISFGILMFLGLVSSTLTERLHTEHAAQMSQALQLAHSGTEYALWEINYGDADYAGAGWTPSDGSGTVHTYTGIPGVSVTVTDVDPNPISVSSQGTEQLKQQISRTIGVTVPNPGGESIPGLFAHGLYTANGYWNEAYIYLNKNVTVNGYNSDVGQYGGGNILSNVVVRSDATPLHDVDWVSMTSDPTLAGAIVLDGDASTKSKVYGTLQLRKLTSGSGSEEENLDPFAEDQPGFVFYPEGPADTVAAATAHQVRTDCGAGGNQPCIIDHNDGPSVSDIKVPYTAQSGWIPGASAPVSVSAGTNRRICPGQTKEATRIDVIGANLIVGCTTDSTDPFYNSGGNCNALVAGPTGAGTATCTGDLSRAVTISTGRQNVSGDGALKVWCSGGTGPNACNATTGDKGANIGRIVVYNPLELYYDQVSATAGVSGLKIASGGIVNRIKKAGGTDNYDPSKLNIYGGEFTPPNDTSIFYSNTTNFTSFYGTIFNPHGLVSFNNAAPLQFYGALNVKRIDTNTTPINFHWDMDFNNSFPGTVGGGAACPCLPNAGTWTLTNN